MIIRRPGAHTNFRLRFHLWILHSIFISDPLIRALNAVHLSFPENPDQFNPEANLPL